MTIEYTGDCAAFKDVVGVEEAEALVAWLQRVAAPRVDLSGCTHLHPANLQVLMAARPTVGAWPDDATLTVWLKSALSPPEPSAGRSPDG